MWCLSRQPIWRLAGWPVATHVEFKKTGEESQCNDENTLVKCDQNHHSVVAMPEKTYHSEGAPVGH